MTTMDETLLLLGFGLIMFLLLGFGLVMFLCLCINDDPTVRKRKKKMDDEILDLNNQILNLMSAIDMARFDMPDIRDLKNKDDEYSAWSDLDDLRDKLEEAIDLIDCLRMNYEYE